MRTELVILPHPGLGDLMTSNGIIRYYNETHRLIIGIRNENLKNAQFMFRDIDVRFFTGSCDEELRYIVMTYFSHIPRIGLGYFKGDNCRGPFPTGNFLKLFYNDANVDFEYMYSKFFVLRDVQREQTLYDKIVAYLGTDKYIVIHDCPPRSLYLDETLIDFPEGVAKLYIGKDRCPVQGETVFDYRMVLEKCVAFHGFNSMFPVMIDLWNIPVKTKVLHLYPRPTPSNFASEYHKPGWISIDKPSS
jgi:hypothetical protein